MAIEHENQPGVTIASRETPEDDANVRVSAEIERAQPAANSPRTRKLSDWLRGALTGGIALALLAFAMSVGWDQYKVYRDNREREAAFKQTLAAEIDANLLIVAENVRVLTLEQQLLNENRYTVKALRQVHQAVITDLLLHPPSFALTDIEFRKKIQAIALLTDEIDETLRSRELYKISGQPLDTYKGGMREFDNILLEGLGRLPAMFEEVRRTLQIK